MVIRSEIDDRIEKCQKILEADPSSQIFAALAEACRKNGDLEKAFRICQNGLKIHPDYGSAHVIMAKINLDRGLYDWAEIEVEKAAKNDGYTRTVEMLQAEIYIYKGQFNDAIKILRRLSEADPDNSQIKKLLDIAQRIPEEQALMQASHAGSVRVVRNKNKTTGKAEIEKPPEVKVEEEDIKYSSKDILIKGVAVPSVNGALFLNFEGLVVETEWSLEFDWNTCGAVFGEVEKQLEKELVENSFGKVKTVLLETETLVYYLIKVDDGVFLFVANKSVNLGSLRMRLEKLFEKYQH